MKLLQKLAWVLYLAFLCTSFSKAQTLDPTQVYTTGNIVLPTEQVTTPWVNGVYQNSLTCWGWGDPGYCGPNAIVRPGNNINFSYGSTYLYQEQSVAGLLPSSVSGLRVNGFNFSFMAKNGNGWDDGRIDNLYALVRFWDTTGGKGATNLLEKYDYNLTYKFNWTDFNFNETFASPRNLTDIGKVQYGFLGKDNNGWAGPYGPEIYNVSFSLKYSVDPCIGNPMYSPTCPGYLDALNALTKPTSTQTTATTTVVATIAPTPVTTVSEPVTATTTAAPTTVTTSQPVSAAQVAASQPPTQTKAGEVQQAGSTKQTTVTTSQILSILSNEQSRIGGVEKAVVQNANEQAAKLSEQAKQEAETVAVALTTQSVNSSLSQTSSANNTSQTKSASQSITILQQPQQTSVVTIGVNRTNNNTQNTSVSSTQQIIQQQQTQAQQFTPTPHQVKEEVATNITTPIIISKPQEQQVAASSFVQPISNTVIQEPLRVATPIIEIDIPKNEGIKLSGRNPISDYLSAPLVIQNQIEQRTETVKQNVQNNEIAGGVDITAIAKQPTGYSQYLVTLSDVPFYSPKEIYKNQNTVDNVRIMRGLTGRSDSLHEEMVRQQYRLGN